MEFARKNEVRWLFDHRNQPGEEASVKVIAGLRRVGKTYLLGTLFKNFLIGEKHFKEENIASIDLSKIPDDSIRTAQKLKESILEKIRGNHSLSFVFVDEVQLAGDGFAETIKTLAKSFPLIDFYVTGSTSELTSSEILAKFGSETSSLLIRPLSYREVNEVLKMSVLEYQSYGGIPKVLLAKKEDKESVLSSLLNDVFISDILDQAKERGLSETEAERTSSYLLANLANFTESETIAQGIIGAKEWNRLKPEERMVKTAEISSVIADIKKTYLLESITQKGLEGKTLLADRNKLYCVDLGLLNAGMSFHPDLTKRYENAVYLDLISRGYRVLVERYIDDKSIDSSGKATPKEKEIDFIADQGDQHISVQVVFRFSSTKRFHEEIDNLVDYAKVSRCYCITEDPVHPPVSGVEFLTLEELFNKENL
jgi:predicted AAA+ superfamily ATPase